MTEEERFFPPILFRGSLAELREFYPKQKFRIGAERFELDCARNSLVALDATLLEHGYAGLIYFEHNRDRTYFTGLPIVRVKDGTKR